MEIILKSILYGAAGFIFTTILTPAIKPIAQRFNLTDIPGSRKLHLTPIPLIGGITIFISVFLTFFISPEMYAVVRDQQALFMSGFIMIIIGIIDDKFDIAAKNKLLIEFFVSFSMATAGFRITSFYGFLGIHELPVIAQYLLTMIITTGAVNAFNLMDGVDGLAGQLSIIGFVILIILSVINENYELTVTYSIFIGAISGFLKFNLSDNKIFMGDAGALYLGHILINSSIYMLIQHPKSSTVQPVFLLIIVGYFLIPVLDSLRVYLGRMKKGKSPFKADRTHLHHLFLLMGFSHRYISSIISILSAFILILGLTAYYFLSLTAAVLIIIALFCAIGFVLNLNKKLVGWREKIKLMENE